MNVTRPSAVVTVTQCTEVLSVWGVCVLSSGKNGLYIFVYINFLDTFSQKFVLHIGS